MSDDDSDGLDLDMIPPRCFGIGSDSLRVKPIGQSVELIDREIEIGPVTIYVNPSVADRFGPADLTNVPPAIKIRL